MTEVLFLESEDITGLANPDEYVDIVYEAYKDIGSGGSTRPRTKLVNDNPKGMFTGYMAVLPDIGAMGGYMYAAGFGKKDSWFMAPIYDVETGKPLALIDGASMNPFKTGATGAVAADLLAKENIKQIGIIGSGAQARGQIKAAATVRDIDRGFVYSPTQKNRKKFSEEMSKETGIDLKPVENSDKAVIDSDIVITATTSSTPVFNGDLIQEGTHITAMGQYDKNKREVDTETIKQSKYIPDLRERVFQDAGAFLYAYEKEIVSKDHIYAELGEIASGKIKGRQSKKEITLFDSGGTAIETVATGYMLYKKAKNKGIGKKINFAPGSKALKG